MDEIAAATRRRRDGDGHQELRPAAPASVTVFADRTPPITDHSELTAIGDRLIAARGVKHGRLVLTTVGNRLS